MSAICAVCQRDELPTEWFSVMWCDGCLTRALELLRQQPKPTILEVREQVAAERGGAPA